MSFIFSGFSSKNIFQFWKVYFWYSSVKIKIIEEKLVEFSLKRMKFVLFLEKTERSKIDFFDVYFYLLFFQIYKTKNKIYKEKVFINSINIINIL